VKYSLVAFKVKVVNENLNQGH